MKRERERERERESRWREAGGRQRLSERAPVEQRERAREEWKRREMFVGGRESAQGAADWAF